jgi:hypothetical protein
MEMPLQGYSQAGCRESSAKLAAREIAPDREGVLPISIRSVYSFPIIVPVVQRIERGFPKSFALNGGNLPQSPRAHRFEFGASPLID